VAGAGGFKGEDDHKTTMIAGFATLQRALAPKVAIHDVAREHYVASP